MTLDELQDAERVAAKIIPLERLLPGFPAVSVTDQGREFVSHGREVSVGKIPASEWVRIVDAAGTLLALGTPGQTPGSLHPAVVLI